MTSIWGRGFWMLSIIHSDARCPYVIAGLNYSHLGLLETTQTCTSHLHVHRDAQAVNKKRHFGTASHRGNVMKRKSGCLNNRVTHKDRTSTYRLTHTYTTYTHACLHACLHLSLTVMGGNRQGTNEVHLHTCRLKTGMKKTAPAHCLSPHLSMLDSFLSLNVVVTFPGADESLNGYLGKPCSAKTTCIFSTVTQQLSGFLLNRMLGIRARESASTEACLLRGKKA